MKTKKLKSYRSTMLMVLFLTACYGQSIKNTSNAIVSSIKNGFTIHILNKERVISSAIKNTLINTVHEVYPKMVKYFNLNAYKSINITMDSSYDRVAYIDPYRVTTGFLNWLKLSYNKSLINYLTLDLGKENVGSTHRFKFIRAVDKLILKGLYKMRIINL